MAALSNHTPCGLVKWTLLATLVVLLLAPPDAVSLDCSFAIKLFKDATKECESGVRHEGVKYQPCEYAKLLETNYRTCTGTPPVVEKEKKGEFGVAAVGGLSTDKRMVVASNQTSYKSAERAAVRACNREIEARCNRLANSGAEIPKYSLEDPSNYGWYGASIRDAKEMYVARCKEKVRTEYRCNKIAGFSDNECFGAAGALFKTGRGYLEFTFAKGNSLRQVELGAIRKCEQWRHPEFTIYDMNNKFSGHSCTIITSGCSPREVLAGMKKSRMPTTSKDLKKRHAKEAKTYSDARILEEWSRAEPSIRVPEYVRGIQWGLKKHGFYSGDLDGKFTMEYFGALSAWMRSRNLSNVLPTHEQAKSLMD